MPEEWGKIVVQATPEVRDLFKKKRYSEALERLASDAGMAAGVTRGLIDACQRVAVSHGYVELSYDCAELADVSEALVDEAAGLEYYARHTDEYGTMTFLAITDDGEKISLVFDQDGDAMEDDDYRGSVTEDLRDWMTAVPDEVKSQFESFVDFEPEDYIYE